MSDRSAPPSPSGPPPADPPGYDSSASDPQTANAPILPPPPESAPDAAPKLSRKERKAAAARDLGPESSTTTSAPADSESDTAVRAGFAESLRAKLASDGAADATSAPVVATKPTKPAKAKPRGPRRARLRLTRIDPWSVMKTSFLLSIAFGIVTVVSVAMIWQVLNSAGVWDSINQTVRDVIDDQSSANFDVRDYVGTDRVLGFTMLVAAVDVILLTAIATLGAFLYNMTAALLGGIEVTLAEDH